MPIKRSTDFSHIVRSMKSENALPLMEWLTLKKEIIYGIGRAYFHQNKEIELSVAQSIQLAIDNIDSYVKDQAFEHWFIKLFVDECEKLRTVDLSDTNKKEMKELLSFLNIPTRQMIVLKHFGGYSYVEISKILNQSEHAVKRHVYRGFKYIRACY
ncbi:hypothetical protein CR194_10890 [Salipaludibacillus keqinensis]|uniref:RNA polymerase sigma factor 70 region 4 type 2 domain-containing protein n=1 Tax=Salipaludibacillus keqinensis TaxID=2045207 RepID=A0A323THK8_9BACI|nr:sigma factor-like helix-turn-helix DNA-binding protein [Salipaludibacillus keqinensis]PYZ93656.1 hypothetical protein CR194_10890 [Salipaludibacillus keqinensis]